MKLFFCPNCQDVVRLKNEVRYCECKKSSGKYLENGIDAKIFGKAIPLGFANKSLAYALNNRPENGQGLNFDAFVIPKKCKTVEQSA